MPLPLPLVVYADAELVITTYLRGALAARAEPYAQGVTVATRLTPGDSPTRFIRVRRAGGTATPPVIDTPQVVCQVWHEGDQERMQLAQLARGLLHQLPGTVQSGVACYRVQDVLGPTPLPDPEDPTRSIVQFTVTVGLRGATPA